MARSIASLNQKRHHLEKVGNTRRTVHKGFLLLKRGYHYEREMPEVRKASGSGENGPA